MTEIPKEIQDMFDTYPEEEELKDFDSFLIGDGSAELMSRMDKPKTNRNSQLTGIYSLEDLGNITKVKESLYDDSLTDDLEEYNLELEISEEPLDYYFKIKKEVFSVYNFIELKSKKYVGKPFKEIDLVVTGNERYQLQYIINNVSLDYGIINSLAQVRALSDMGFLEAKFLQNDCCPLCEAFDGNVYNLTQIGDLFGSGKTLIHGNCIGTFIPVIRDRSNVIDLVVDIESTYIGNTKVNNLPIEYTSELYKIVPMAGVKVVHFVDIPNEFEDYDGEFVRLVGSELYVHNSYYGLYSPLDFLRGWVECLDVEVGSLEKIESSVKSGDIYYLDGKKVVEIDGLYFDVDTKEQVR